MKKVHWAVEALAVVLLAACDTAPPVAGSTASPVAVSTSTVAAGPGPTRSVTAPSARVSNSGSTLSAADLGTVADTTNRLLGRLPARNKLSVVEVVVGPHPPTVAVGPAWSQGSWIVLQSAAVDPVDRLRARWQATMVVAAVWHLRHLAGLEDVDGGELWPMRPDVDGSGEGAHWWNSLQQAQFAYRNSAFEPATLPIVEPSSLRSAVEREAASAGLSVTAVAVSTVQGSAVEVDAVAGDPVAYACRFGTTSPILVPDGGDLEGIMTVIRDPAGNVISSGQWTSGLQGGEGGLGPRYVQYDRHTPESEAHAEKLCAGR